MVVVCIWLYGLLFMICLSSNILVFLIITFTVWVGSGFVFGCFLISLWKFGGFLFSRLFIDG